MQFALPFLVFLYGGCTSGMVTPTSAQPLQNSSQTVQEQVIAQSPQNSFSQLQKETKGQSLRRMPYFPESGYRHVDASTWFSYNSGIPYIPGVDNTWTWRDALAYSNGELVAITKDAGNKEDVRVINIDQYGNPNVLVGQEFSASRNVSLVPEKFNNDSQKILLAMQHNNNKKTVVVIDKSAMSADAGYEYDDISVIGSGGRNFILGTSYGADMPHTDAYAQNGERFDKVELPKEFIFTDDMKEKIDRNKNGLIATLVSNPPATVKEVQEILGTDNPFLTSTAMRYATKDVQVVDEKESKPLWRYAVDYKINRDGASARVALDSLGWLYVLNQLGVADVPVPWADGQSAALIIMKNSENDPKNTYLNVRLRRGDDGKPHIEGGVELGEYVLTSPGYQAYVRTSRDVASAVKNIKENQIPRTKDYLDEVDRRGKQQLEKAQQKATEKIKKSPEVIKEGATQIQQQIKPQADELKRKLEEEIRRRNEEASRKAEEEKKIISQKANKAMDAIKDFFKKK